VQSLVRIGEYHLGSVTCKCYRRSVSSFQILFSLEISRFTSILYADIKEKEKDYNKLVFSFRCSHLILLSISILLPLLFLNYSFSAFISRIYEGRFSLWMDLNYRSIELELLNRGLEIDAS